MNAQKGDIVDHINGDQLDNQKENLRITTRSINRLNSSTVKGYSKQGNKWRAQIKLNGKIYYLGMFTTEEEARQAYLTARNSFVGNMEMQS